MTAAILEHLALQTIKTEYPELMRRGFMTAIRARLRASIEKEFGPYQEDQSELSPEERCTREEYERMIAEESAWPETIIPDGQTGGFQSLTSRTDGTQSVPCLSLSRSRTETL